MVNKKHLNGDHSTLFGKAISVVCSQQVKKKKPLVGEFDQMPARAVIKRFGAAATAAMIKEFLQLFKLLMWGLMSQKHTNTVEVEKRIRSLNQINNQG